MSDTLPAFQQNLAFKARESKKDRIQRMFENNVGQRFSTSWLHLEFGVSFRTRVSEINNDKHSPITIKNHTWFENGKECSEYYSEVKGG